MVVASTVIHYHGGPITPDPVALRTWKGRHAFLSFATIPDRQIELAAGVCQSFALDNGAFTIWRKTGEPVDDWSDYYLWCKRWLHHPACDWAVIPDVIGGTEEENDELVDEWPFGFQGVPVWHTNESVDRLVMLAREWPRVALGSAAEYDVKSPKKAVARILDVLPYITDVDGWLITKLHGLRMLNPAITSVIPLSSGDSTNVAFNHGKNVNWKGTYLPRDRETRAQVLVERIEAVNTPGRIRRPRPKPQRI